jgi:hypothetical protein
MSSGCVTRVGAQVKSDALWGRAFLEHDDDGVNDFLIQAGVTQSSHAQQSRPLSACPVRSALKSALCSFAHERAISAG